MTPEQLAALVAENRKAAAAIGKHPGVIAKIIVKRHTATADAIEHLQAEVARLSHALAAERKQPTRTFIRDRNGREIMLGDRVLHHNAGPNTKPEYWNGEYEVRWEAPSFVLRHVGGGLASDMGFTFKHYPEALEVIPQPVGNGETLAKHGSKT